jgi:hypothetical protein
VNEESLRFYRKLYMLQAIRSAIRGFEGLARFEVERDGLYYVVHVRDISPEVDGDVVGEFANFVLAHTIECKRPRTA